ncbi:myeloid differentiation primary response protein MyD88-like isoform X1 [Neodiprion pinetum]|uniref:myeloid differentiation primary response protein MyD88-like isoform X1 n=2 Tax=Neodiprion pinetum TaxID=441929 RepID=UPI001EDF3A8A|nr:myeloid differentiation primary response protein MyD88-like isoform X1 [Neodiprion pinetum]
MTDFSTVPIVALSDTTKESISSLLNPTKCLPADNGLLRDWRGLAELAVFDSVDLPNLSSKSDPCGYILSIIQKKSQGLMFATFQALLEKLERWDVIDDTAALMERDAQIYKQCSQRTLTSANAIDNHVEEQIITYDDLWRVPQGLGKQQYDAFLLFAEEDINFVDELCEKLEYTYELKLCRKDRDFIVGLPFEHSAIMKLISERCNRLIAILSPNFVRSSVTEFFVNFTQAQAIETRARKIIPCFYKRCEVPVQLRYYHILDFNIQSKNFNFWEKLSKSIKTPDVRCRETRATALPTPAVEKSKPCKFLQHTERNECSMVERVGEVKKTSCESYEPKLPCNIDNVDVEPEIIPETVAQKSKGPSRLFNFKKFLPSKQSKVKCSSEELNESRSLSAFDLSSLDSINSLSDTCKKKKTTSNKYKNKISVFMKS